jgi:hypothetical protein
LPLVRSCLIRVGTLLRNDLPVAIGYRARRDLVPDDYATSVVVEGFAQPVGIVANGSNRETANSFHPAALIELLSRRNRQTGEQSSLAVDETFQEIEQLLQPVLAEALLNVAVDDKTLG